MSRDEESILRRLDDEQEDWQCLLVYSDLMEEEGNERKALALRWLAQNKKRPYYSYANQGYYWFVEPFHPESFRDDPESDLPQCVFRHLSTGMVSTMAGKYKKASVAFLAATDGLEKAFEEGWTG